MEMKKGPFTCSEIEKTIAKSKSNRAPGEDRITADMLKADTSMSAKCLVGLFNKVWTEEKVPDAWKKAILIKLPKKGVLSQCNNWRGINLLSVPGKIFCRVIFYRIKSSVDKALREEQAGLREGRSSIDQIFILRTIIEQSIEWNSSTYINFIDFKKAFDSVHHKT
ncbi:endonuclease-reverse transcriptase [Elysia marginata]|uniref:Endonuclease-reverse transcriptase n=1 Tax=Elysia marginata TaxID=1093978 RepID=A0AAV4FFJ8_9GAST|nr:endonuclease-reverse transcriptase [Elysia marginata]